MTTLEYFLWAWSAIAFAVAIWGIGYDRRAKARAWRLRKDRRIWTTDLTDL